MASFPTTNITFASRSAGQTIASAHVNSLQEEVAAIEDGYLNGTARLNAGASTLASLSVTGGSTFGGAMTFSTGLTISAGGLTVSTGNTSLGENLSVAGNSTIGGSLVCSSVVTAAAQPRVIVRTSNTLTTSNESTAVSFIIQDTTVGGMHSTSSSPQNVTVPHTGLYLISATTWYAQPAGNGERILRVKQNSTTIARASFESGTGTPHGTLNVSDICELVANDVITVTLDGSGQATTFGSTSSPQQQTKLSVARLW